MQEQYFQHPYMEAWNASGQERLHFLLHLCVYFALQSVIFFSTGGCKVVADFVFCCTTTLGRGKGKQMCRVARRQIYSELQQLGTSTTTLLPPSLIPSHYSHRQIDQKQKEMTCSCLVLKCSVSFNFEAFIVPQINMNVFKGQL